MTLSTLLTALERFADPAEPLGIIIVKARGQHGVRVVVAGEVVSHVEAPTREKAIEIALADLRAAAADQAFVDACGREAAQ